MKKRTFRITTDYVTVSVLDGSERKFDSKRFVKYIQEALPNAANDAMSAEGIKGNPRFKNTTLKIKNIEAGFRSGRNAAMCPTKHITVYFDTHCKNIPFSLRHSVKQVIENFDRTLAPASLQVVTSRVF